MNISNKNNTHSLFFVNNQLSLVNFFRQNGFLLLLLLVATVLRLTNIGFNSLYQDEILTIGIAQSSWLECLSVDVHPPLYFLLLHIWLKVFGEGEVVLRMFSALCGVATVGATYLLFRSWFEEQYGRLIAIIVALSSFHIFLSHEIRAYTLLSFLSLVTLYFFTVYIQSFRIKPLILYIITAILCCYTHNLGVLVVFLSNCLFLIHFYSNILGNRLKPWIVANGIIVLFSIPWVIQAYKQWKWTVVEKWFPSVSPARILSWINDFYGWDHTTGTICLSLLGIYGIIKGFINKGHRRSSIKIIGILLVQFVLVAVVSCTYTTIAFGSRQVIQASFGFYGAVALSIYLTKNPLMKTIIASLILAWLFLSCYQYYTAPSKTEWKRAAQFILKNIGHNDAVIVPEWELMERSFSYYYKNNRNVIKITETNDVTDWNFQITDKHIQSALIDLSKKDPFKKHENIYMVCRTDPAIKPLFSAINNELIKHYQKNEIVLLIDSQGTMMKNLGYYYPLQIKRYGKPIISDELFEP